MERTGPLALHPAGAAPVTAWRDPIGIDPQRTAAGRRGGLRFPRGAVIIAACAGQIALGLAFRESKALAVAHAAMLALLGLYSVITRREAMLVQILAYLTGAEVVWRQSRAPIFFMAAPYLVIALCGLSVIVIHRGLNSSGRIAGTYALLLLPSAMITVTLIGGGSRELLAFALAGPLALAAAAMMMSQVVVSAEFYRRILWTIVVSAFAPWAYAIGEIRSYLETAGAIEFHGASNFVTSGGFGPVHVSALLSAGTVAAILLVLTEKKASIRLLAGIMGLALIVQSLLTFSRGGIYSAAIAAAALLLAAARDRQTRQRMLLVVALALAVGYVFVIPRLESFTAGAFGERFSSSSTSRDDLASNDLQVFRDHLFFGVGPGMGKYQRIPFDLCQIRLDKCSEEVSSHTEFTRVLSEHGLAGVLALVALGVLAMRAIGPGASSRVLSAPWLAWTVAQMAYANLRIVAVPIAFGLALLQVSSGGDRVTDESVDDPLPEVAP